MLYKVIEDVAELNDVAAEHSKRVVKMLKTQGQSDVSTPQHLYMEGLNTRKYS